MKHTTKKILISAPVHPSLIEQFSAAGLEVAYRPDLTYNELQQLIPVVEGLVVTTRLKIDQPVLDAAQNLQWIGRLGSGMELIDETYAAQKGIRCISTPEGNRNAVAEHALGLLLNLANHISRSFNEIKNGQWLRNENRGTELRGKTIGVIGFGNNGSAFARLLGCFGVTVLAYDKFRKGFGEAHIRESTVEEICRQAHVVSFHVPLTADTYHMAGREFFAALQQRPLFMSTCRGPVTDTAALINALQEGQISGAALDVLENEKLHTYSDAENEQLRFLTSHPQVVLTPHIAGYSHEAFMRMGAVLLEKLGLKQQAE